MVGVLRGKIGLGGWTWLYALSGDWGPQRSSGWVQPIATCKKDHGTAPDPKTMTGYSVKQNPGWACAVGIAGDRAYECSVIASTLQHELDLMDGL